jgi:hypothetical protein
MLRAVIEALVALGVHDSADIGKYTMLASSNLFRDAALSKPSKSSLAQKAQPQSFAAAELCAQTARSPA